MKITTIIGSILAVGLIAGSLTACISAKERQAKLEAQSRISKADAERIALAKVPGGTVTESDIEKESGKLIWSFNITTPGARDITELQEDAVSGAVVSVEKETPAEQAKEKEADAREKK